jgi:hypothetical protein
LPTSRRVLHACAWAVPLQEPGRSLVAADTRSVTREMRPAWLSRGRRLCHFQTCAPTALSSLRMLAARAGSRARLRRMGTSSLMKYEPWAGGAQVALASRCSLGAKIVSLFALAATNVGSLVASFPSARDRHPVGEPGRSISSARRRFASGPPASRSDSPAGRASRRTICSLPTRCISEAGTTRKAPPIFLRARRSLAHVFSQHDEVDRCLAGHRARLPALERRQRDHDLCAGRTQPVGLGPSRADWIFRVQPLSRAPGPDPPGQRPRS